jgi:microcystin-dependent protein
MGEIAGSETVTLTTAQLPAHRHGLGANTGAATTTDPNLTIPAAGNAYTTAAENTVMKGTFETGGGQPVPVLQPLLAINFIIALQGIFPSQN